MAKTNRYAVNGEELRAIVLQHVEDLIAQRDDVSRHMAEGILARVKATLEQDGRFEYHLTYDPISFSVNAVLWTHRPEPFPWSVTVTFSTPWLRETPEWTVAVTGATPVALPAGQPAVGAGEPPVARAATPPADPVAGDPAAVPEPDLNAPDLAPRLVAETTAHGLPIETAVEALPPDALPASERDAMAKEIADRNAQLARHLAGRETPILLTDETVLTSPNAAREAAGLPMPKPGQVVGIGGVKTWVDRPADPGQAVEDVPAGLGSF